MSTLVASSLSQPILEDANGPEAGILSRLMAAMVQSRTREAQRRTANYVMALDAARLAELGFSAAEIAAIKAGTPIGDVLAQRIG
jgi:hypothetical protein